MVHEPHHNEVIDGVFSEYCSEMKTDDIEKMKQRLSKAQAKGTVHWIDIVSFDNDFLKKEGILNEETNELNQFILQQSTRKMMQTWENTEDLKSLCWFASIHRNTDNVHIHLSSVEESPSRKLEKRGDHFEPRGKRKLSTINKMKMSFGNELLGLAPSFKEFSEQRNRIIKMKKELLKRKALDRKLQGVVSELEANHLPDDWRKKIKLNHVSYKKMNKNGKKLIDGAVQHVLKDNPELQAKYENYSENLKHYNS